MQPGDYTIEATTYHAAREGDFTLTIEGLGETEEDASDPQPDPEPATDECLESVDADGSIEGTWDDTCVSDRAAISGAADRYARFYTFTLDAAVDVTIALESDEDTYLYLLDGHGRSGTVLYEDDDIDYPSDTNSRLSERLEAGDYTIEATTYYAQKEGDFTLEIEGLDEGTTATAPDLEVGMPSVDDDSPAAGATFTLSTTVTNAGDGASAATTLRYYQSTDSTITSDDTAMGTDDIGALAASGTSDQSIDLTAPSDAKTYY